jgi:hypothetical protein
MTRTSRTTAALGLAVLALAAPSAARAAGPEHVPVPAGQLQHTVTAVTFPKSGNTFPHHALRNERWITATAGRELVTDVTAHKVREDCSYTLVVVRCWAAPINRTEPRNGTLYIMQGDARLLQSWIDIGAGIKEEIGNPRGYTVTGTTTFLGRPAVTLTQPQQGSPNGGEARATVIAEADNDYPLFRDDIDVGQPFHELDGRKGKENVEQVTTTKVMETISPAGVRLTIARHPRARVRDDRPAARAARRRAAARHKRGAATTTPGYAAEALARR